MTRFVIVGLLSLTAAGGTTPAAADGPVAVVVNASNSIQELRSEDVARLFLKKVRTWPDGRMASPVDQSGSSQLRAVFGKQILGLSLGEQKEYWLTQTLSGRELPPRALDGDAAVLDYVGNQMGAIAYVAAGTELPPTVRALKLVSH